MILSHHPLSGTKSKLDVVVKDLNRTHKLFPFLYYLHFVLVRIIVGLCIFLSAYVDSVILWGVLSGIQLLFFFYHFIKLYEKCTIRVLAMLRELQILFVVLFIFALQFKDQSTETLKLKYLKPFMIVFMSMTGMFTLISLMNSFVKLIMWIIKLVKKLIRYRRKPNPAEILAKSFIKEQKEIETKSNVASVVPFAKTSFQVDY